jgi:hypothetical protein
VSFYLRAPPGIFEIKIKDMPLSFEKLRALADLVKNEILSKTNTALRIGSLFSDLIDCLEATAAAIEELERAMEENLDSMEESFNNKIAQLKTYVDQKIAQLESLLNQIPAGLSVELITLK